MRRGFTFLELIFVIVVMGILAKFGTNLMMTTYESYAQSSVNNRLQTDVELTLKQIANRLQYRIKDSVITRTAPGAAPNSLASAVGGGFTLLEWVGYDIDGWLGLDNGAGFNSPTWSGFIDVDAPGAVAAQTYVESPGTDTTDANTLITSLRANASTTGFNNSAIFFTGANSDIQTDYGWGGVALANQSFAAHRIISGGGVTRLNALGGTNFAGIDIYENYKLAWTAYSIRIMDNDGDGDNDLVMYYDYQPWEGESLLNNGTAVLLLPNVDTFKFSAIGDTIKVQVCVNEQNSLGGGTYALCKETAIF